MYPDHASLAILALTFTEIRKENYWENILGASHLKSVKLCRPVGTEAQMSYQIVQGLEHNYL